MWLCLPNIRYITVCCQRYILLCGRRFHSRKQPSPQVASNSVLASLTCIEDSQVIDTCDRPAVPLVNAVVLWRVRKGVLLDSARCSYFAVVARCMAGVFRAVIRLLKRHTKPERDCKILHKRVERFPVIFLRMTKCTAPYEPREAVGVLGHVLVVPNGRRLDVPYSVYADRFRASHFYTT